MTDIWLTECWDLSTELIETIYSIPGLKRMKSCSLSPAMATFAAPPNTSCISLICVNLPFSQMVTQLPNLRNLAVSVIRCQDLVLFSVHCPLLEHVQADLYNKLSLEQATTIARNWQHIKELQLGVDRYQYLCDGSVVLLLLSECLGLERLAMLASSNVTTTFTHSKVSTQGSMSHLQELTVGKLDEQTLQRIVHLCPLLHTLSIQYYVEYYDELVYLHLINNSSIKTLHITNCLGLYTDDLVGLYTIEKLVLRSVGTHDSLTASGIVQFVQQCPTLHTLHIHNCPGIDHTVVRKVLRASAQLTDLAFTTERLPGANRALGMLREVVIDGVVSTVTLL